MADIFLSYSAKDRDRARCLADRLQAAGWSVWWDRRIPAGRTWRSVLAHELETMRCMVVLWSANSVVSDWVCEEATEGRQLGKLVPVAIDSVRPPAGFRELQAADLVAWDGSASFAGLQQLLDDISRLIGPPVPAVAAPAVALAIPLATPLATAPAAVPAPTPAPAPTPPSPRWRWAAAAAVLLLVSTGAWLQKTAPTAPSAQPVPTAEPKSVEAPATAPATAQATTQAATQAATPASSLAQAPANASANPEAGTSTSTQQPAPRERRPRPASLPPVSGEPTKPRCSALLERAALGEALSAEAQAFLRQECRP